MKIQIRPGLEIGDDCPPFIIAEVGSNWRDLDDCLISIEKAKECGADAVKFQAFNSRALYGIYNQMTYPTYQQGLMVTKKQDGVYYDMPGTLPLDWLPKLKQIADACGIEFMCSAFSPELIDAVDPFVNIHKLASAEMCHVRMLEKLAKIGKPVFMSTGAHTVGEIGQAMNILGYSGGGRMGNPDCWFTPLVLMYCVSAYPAQEIDLGNIQLLRDHFETLIGYSDHSTDISQIPKAATTQGACVVEKHFTAIDADTPDRPHSLSPDQFRSMVLSIHNKRSITLGPTLEEKPMILRHNRRLIATKEIKEGEAFREGINFGIYRSLKESGDSLCPFRIGDIEGKKAKKEMKAGDGITEGDVCH